MDLMINLSSLSNSNAIELESHIQDLPMSGHHYENDLAPPLHSDRSDAGYSAARRIKLLHLLEELRLINSIWTSFLQFSHCFLLNTCYMFPFDQPSEVL